jgi:hypothetical protein
MQFKLYSYVMDKFVWSHITLFLKEETTTIDATNTDVKTPTIFLRHSVLIIGPNVIQIHHELMWHNKKITYVLLKHNGQLLLFIKIPHKKGKVVNKLTIKIYTYKTICLSVCVCPTAQCVCRKGFKWRLSFSNMSDYSRAYI